MLLAADSRSNATRHTVEVHLEVISHIEGKLDDRACHQWWASRRRRASDGRLAASRSRFPVTVQAACEPCAARAPSAGSWWVLRAARSLRARRIRTAVAHPQIRVAHASRAHSTPVRCPLASRTSMIASAAVRASSVPGARQRGRPTAMAHRSEGCGLGSWGCEITGSRSDARARRAGVGVRLAAGHRTGRSARGGVATRRPVPHDRHRVDAQASVGGGRGR